MKHWYKQSHKFTHIAVLYLPSAEFLIHSRSHHSHARSQPRSCWNIKGKAHPQNPLIHTIPRLHSVTDKYLANAVTSGHTLLNMPLLRPLGITRTGTVLPGILLQQHWHRSAGPYSHPAQRIPDSELATSRVLTTEPADTGLNPTSQRRPSGTVGAGWGTGAQCRLWLRAAQTLGR